jgi:aminoglycoside phosphotransferase family enzyme/predicted kinase
MTVQTATTIRSGIIGPNHRTAPQAAPRPSEAEITAFLTDPSSYPERPERVDLIETHAARIFLAGEDVFKIKKHVRLPYLDFTTLAAREATLTRELEINRPAAPDIYLGIKRITRAADGGLAFDGAGETVEFALHMRRFAQEDVLSQAATDGRIDRPLAKAIAEVVFAAHEAAPVVREGDGIARFEKIIADVAEACGASRDVQIQSQRATFADPARAHLDRVRPLLAERARAGFRRRCHGDLHLGNMVLWHGQPLPFDALEFDEDLATIDVLYDLAFLIMDLDHRELRPRANDVLNRYLWRADPRNLEGLAALPLFLALRAGIRTMVDLHRIAGADAALPDVLTDAQRYLEQALQYLAPGRPALIAVGGLSGSGKSTLAAALASSIGIAPGAIHLRSDLERKKLFQSGETERLPDEAYARNVTEQVYATLNQKAASVLGAGYAMIVDAVHSAPEERAAVERIAQEQGAPFLGLWLDAPGTVLKDRVTTRKGDASDATADVVTQQLAYDLGDITWHRLDASLPFDETRAKAANLIEALSRAGDKETRP